jgi:hypothetical protein
MSSQGCGSGGRPRPPRESLQNMHAETQCSESPAKPDERDAGVTRNLPGGYTRALPGELFFFAEGLSPVLLRHVLGRSFGQGSQQ